MEKVVKSVNALKFAYGELAANEEKVLKDGSLTPRERQFHCHAIADAMVSNALKNNSDFPTLLAISLEILLHACGDDNADVRLNAEGSLNRLIKGLYEGSINKILVELFKEIKKNGPPRVLKAALVRFADLCFNIRPAKCRPYMLSLLPCLGHASQRNEEIIQEALAPAVQKIFSNLGSFANEGEVQGLVACFLKNLSRDSVTFRRTAGSCLHSIVSSSRRISITLLPLIDSILDILSQRRNHRSTVLGCLPSLRAISPLLVHSAADVVKKTIAKIFTYCIYYSCHCDHTIVTSALELLDQLIKTFPSPFNDILTYEGLDIHGFESHLGPSPDDTEEVTSSDCHQPNDGAASQQRIVTWKDVCSPRGDDIATLDSSPLATLARMLCQRFLLSSQGKHLLADSQVRVSTKTLALECLRHLITMNPLLLTASLQKGEISGRSLFDVTLYLEHPDPKLRGAAVTLVASYVNGALIQSRGDIDGWWGSCARKHPDLVPAVPPAIDDLVAMLTKSFSDDVSTCLRHSCAAASLCVDALLRSAYFRLGLSLLRDALPLIHNNYWLLKVDLLSVLGSLNYRQITFLESQQQAGGAAPVESFQDAALSAMLRCLSEEDGRVRKSAAEALLNAVESLTLRSNVESDLLSVEAFQLCRQQLGRELLGNVDHVEMTSHGSDTACNKNLLKIYRGFDARPGPGQIEDSLSLLIGDVMLLLARATTKSVTQGCLLVMKLLSSKYPPGSYPLSWGCHIIDPELLQTRDRSRSNSSDSTTYDDTARSRDPVQNLGPLPMVMGLLKSSWLPLDIRAHCDVITLAGNLLAGAAIYGFHRSNDEQNLASRSHSDAARSSHGPPTHAKGWTGIPDHNISKYARDLFVHLVKVVSICHHVIADLPANATNKSLFDVILNVQSVLPTISSATSIPSPMKKKDKKEGEGSKLSPPAARKILPSNTSKSTTNKEEGEREKASKKSLGSFHHNRVLMKLHDLLNGAYTNYKSNLEFGEGDRFCMFVASSLDALSQLLELAIFQDIASSTEEILSYLKTLFQVQPPLTVQCVQQLLKALFGTNMLAQLDLTQPRRTSKTSVGSHRAEAQQHKPTISHQIFHFPLNNLAMSLANSSFHNFLSSGQAKDGDGWFGSIKKKVEEKLSRSSKQTKGAKASISNYIRLFESIVIKALKSYTVSSSVDLQKHVLNMLAQLVQLRVNYNMLDSDQVFIGFIIKQFESIETGMIRQSESLVPHVFFFLVLLSYEKYHSKNVIGMSKVIQLCDGLMASGRGVASHVIPALEPIVHDLFVVRATSKYESDDVTQREVLLQMILRLLQHPEVYAMTTTVLRFYHQADLGKWKRSSHQIVDALLPMLARLQIPLSSHDDVVELYSLFESLSPTAFRPTLVLLSVLFTSTPKVTKATTAQWMAKILLLLRLLVCHVSEAEMMGALDEMGRSIREEEMAGNPPPSGDAGADMMARFFEYVIDHVSGELVSSLSSTVAAARPDEMAFVVKEFIELLILLAYIHRSGTYKKFSASSRDLLRTGPAKRLHDFMFIGNTFPIVTLLWGQYLTYVGHIDILQWEALTGAGSQEKPNFNKRMVHAGSLVLLCDYVFCLQSKNSLHRGRLYPSFMCQNANQSELTSWLIEHHLCDVIELCGEAPVEDFLGLVQEPKVASLFLSRIESYCRGNSSIKASFVQTLVRFLASLPESSSVLRLLLSRTFLFSPIIAVSRSSEQVACDVTESLLARDADDAMKIVTSDDVIELIDLFPAGRAKRFPRLRTLLLRLNDHVSRDLTSSPISTNPQPSVDMVLAPADKVWFKSILVEACREDKWSPECAKVMACCEYDDVMEVMNHEMFSSRHLEVCLAYGMSEVTTGADNPPCHDDSLSSIMKASRDTMMNVISKVLGRAPPRPKNQDAPVPLQAQSKEYFHQIDELFGDESYTRDVTSMCACLSRYFHANLALLPQYRLAEAAYPQCFHLLLPSSQMLDWRLRHGSLPPLSVAMVCLEFIQQALKIDAIADMFTSDDDVVTTVVTSLHKLITAYVGQLPSRAPFFPDSFRSQKSDLVCSCFIKMSQLFDYIHLVGEPPSPGVPPQLAGPIHNIILHLCRTQLLNSCIRVPRLLWKYGWNPPCGNGTQFPDIPPDYLQEKEVLSEFVSIINQIGWVGRTQFEETWACLLGVLVSQPLLDASAAKQTHEDAVAVSCLAVRGLTSLVLNCALHPHAGATTTGRFPVYHRHPPMKMTHSKWGKRLVRVLRILHEEILGGTKSPQHCNAHFRYQRHPPDEDINHQLACNTERVIVTSSRYGMGQASARSFFDLHGITPLIDEAEIHSDLDSVNSAPSANVNEESDESDMFDAIGRADGGAQQAHPLSPLRIRDGVDVHSCVQFLLDLYAGWFRLDSGGVGMVSRPLLCECMRSLMLVSDLFTEQHQFEWLLQTVTAFYGSQSNDDDILLQYVVTSLCKASAVLGMGGTLCEVLLPLLQTSLESSLVSCRVAALYGALFCLECYPNHHLKNLVGFLMEMLPAKLVAITGNPSLHNEDFVLALISLAYVMIERCQDVIAPEFISIILQASSLIFSAAETSSRVYHAVAHGLERLVLVFALSSAESEVVLKVAAEQLNHNPSLPRATAACSLMVTCMYCGRMRAAFLTQNDESADVASELEDAVETRLLAMERVSFIFERIRRGRLLDGRVMARILPPILDDFFPPSTILNKVIAEFASNLQPYPDLLAPVLHQVFQSLHNRDKSALVHEWVILSLSNVIQRTPLSTAVWCLTCLFVCASSNHWINSLLPLVVRGMKQPEAEKDWPLFCKAALDFYTNQLSGELDRRSFQSVFISANQEPYPTLLRCLDRARGEAQSG